MNKNNLLWVCALLMLAFGMGSCSSDDDRIMGTSRRQFRCPMKRMKTKTKRMFRQ